MEEKERSPGDLRAHRSYAHAQCPAVCRRCKLPGACRCSVDQNGAQGQWKLFWASLNSVPANIHRLFNDPPPSPQPPLPSRFISLLLKHSIDYALPLFISNVTVTLWAFFLSYITIVRIPHKLGLYVNIPKINNSKVWNCSYYMYFYWDNSKPVPTFRVILILLRSVVECLEQRWQCC